MPPPTPASHGKSTPAWLLLTVLFVIVSVPPLLKIPPPSPRASPMSLYAAVLLVMLLSYQRHCRRAAHIVDASPAK